jgi:hypothetical protein
MWVKLTAKTLFLFITLLYAMTRKEFVKGFAILLFALLKKNIVDITVSIIFLVSFSPLILPILTKGYWYYSFLVFAFFIFVWLFFDIRERMKNRSRV